jgi:hypothetical protein
MTRAAENERPFSRVQPTPMRVKAKLAAARDASVL